MPLDPRLRDYIHSRLMGPLTPTRRPDSARGRTASPLEPVSKKRLRGSVQSDAPMLPRDVHPLDEDDYEGEHPMGEAAGDGADWDDDLDAWQPPREYRSPKDQVIGMIVNHILEPKMFWAAINAPGTITSVPIDYMPDMNPSINAEVNGRIGNSIRVRRLMINAFCYRNMNAGGGDVIRVTLIRDRNGNTAPSSWLDIYTGGADPIHSFIRPDRRQRYDVLIDRFYDMPKLYQPTDNEDNLHYVRLSVPLDDLYNFRAPGTPDQIRYRLYVTSFRGSGSGFQGLAMIKYVDP